MSAAASDRRRALRLGQRYCALGRYREAETQFREAAKAAAVLFGRHSMEVAAALNNRAMVCKYDGRFDTAARIYGRSLQLAIAAYGPEHPALASIYHNLGGLEHARGRFARGEPLARKAVELRRRALGADHPQVAADAVGVGCAPGGLGPAR